MFGGGGRGGVGWGATFGTLRYWVRKLIDNSTSLNKENRKCDSSLENFAVFSVFNNQFENQNLEHSKEFFIKYPNSSAYINRARDQVHVTLTQSRDFLVHSKATLKIHSNLKALFTWKEDDPRIQNVSDNFQEA